MLDSKAATSILLPSFFAVSMAGKKSPSPLTIIAVSKLFFTACKTKSVASMTSTPFSTIEPFCSFQIPNFTSNFGILRRLVKNFCCSSGIFILPCNSCLTL